MKTTPILLLIVLMALSCSSPDRPVLSEAERLELKKAENDSLMVVFDSIMEIRVEVPQLIDSMAISPECLEQFNALARETGGGLKVVANSKFVAKEIAEIIEYYAVDHTDLMIIIDKTSSMADDLGNIRVGLDQVLNSLKEYENIRLSVSTYGDKNIDGALWYDYQNFETDFEGTMEFIETIQMTGGGDFPESVYDGIFEAFQEGFWKSESKRIVVLLGDAPSLDSNYTTHTEKDIIELATSQDIHMNFYPIVLSPYNGELGETKKMQNLTFIESVYPNPSSGEITLKMNQFGSFNLEIFNQGGVLIKSEVISTDTYRTDLYDQPNGLYIIRVSDDDKNFDSRKIILRK
ncbi:T9SS type A sorting domain-containing protein [Cryomorphaceae bacterium 1068]|nr:T9SS type A sorting domain-containing protein [Cryomorphaceae bacterium 1068]